MFLIVFIGDPTEVLTFLFVLLYFMWPVIFVVGLVWLVAKDMEKFPGVKVRIVRDE